MSVTQDFKLPGSPKHLELPEKAGQKLFLAFIASKDPVTKQSWCPDVRAALPVIEAKFFWEGIRPSDLLRLDRGPSGESPATSSEQHGMFIMFLP
ncbi:hypothetical protein DID88_000644 [Monilinia fructigena]|uniref:Thioredoxin domain-containing protein n=1 Tax=Monilinia fructigena TaxID=38457 RepID=A0A395IKH4_9HELO|nr:hypothetical protein DID88_000644 [Monilinia fructigena]